MHADDHLRPWHEAAADLIPRLELFDAHTHTGENDPDGIRCTADELIEGLELARARAVVFTTQEPDGYSAANDRVIDEAERSGGRLVPFCRLDPADEPLREAERALARGARGIKLHPRAEQFRLDEPQTEPIFAVAHERRVPVIVHAGRGIPALGRDALDLAGRYPGARIILAHAGVCDLAWLWRHTRDHPNLFFDTAWWSPVDLLTLHALVPPGQVLFGSDLPYGTTLQSAISTFRCALQSGVPEATLPAIAGEQFERLVRGEDPLDLGPAPGGESIARDLLLERVAAYLQTAIGRMLLSDDAQETLALARLACEVGEDSAQAPVCRSVLALLDRFDHYVENSSLMAGASGERRFPGLHLVVTAAVVALTPDVELPPEPEPVSSGERST